MFTLFILRHCSPYLQTHSVGNPIPLIGNLPKHCLVPLEAQIFYQKPRPINLGNPFAIAFANLENRPSLPSEDEFARAQSAIGEFLKPLFATTLSETQGEKMKDTSLPLPTSSSLEVQQVAEGSNPRMPTARIKIKSKRNSAPLPA